MSLLIEENPELPGRGIEVAPHSPTEAFVDIYRTSNRESVKEGRSSSRSRSRSTSHRQRSSTRKSRSSSRHGTRESRSSSRHRGSSSGVQQSRSRSVRDSSSRSKYRKESSSPRSPRSPRTGDRKKERSRRSTSERPRRSSDRPKGDLGNKAHNSSESLARTFATEDSTNESRKAELSPRSKRIERKSTSDPEDAHMAIEIDIEEPSTVDATKEVEDFTNDPHPSLETPLLYFFLRRHPKLLSAIQGFYDFRWDIAYPLQNRIPCTRWLRKIKIILTWSELFLLLSFFGFLILGTISSFVNPSVSVSGHACRTPLIFCFVTAAKNNLLTFFLGMPVERAIKYHKISARLAYFNSLLHTYVAFAYPVTPDSSSNFVHFLFQDTVCSGGTLLVLFMTAMVVTALPIVRRRIFEFFYLVHIIFAVFLMVAAFYHTGFLVPLLASLTWGLDVLVRKVYMPLFRYPRKAKLEIISDTVVEVSFPKQDGFDFNPSQYIYLCVPKLGYLEWHPFSLSSSPKQKVVTLHIRKGGDWTNALYSMAKQQKEISVLMEGPYGSVGVDLTNPYKYQTVMLFSGGIGVTPMQSLCNSLMYEHNHGMRKLKKLSFVWIERDPVIMPEVDVVRRESIRCLETSPPSSRTQLGSSSLDLEEGFGKRLKRATRRPSLDSIVSDADGATRLATQLLSMVPPGQDTDAQLEQCYPSEAFDGCWDNVEDSKTTADVETGENLRTNKSISFNVDKPHKPWKAGDERSVDESFLDQAFGESNSQAESPLDLQVYLTNKQVSRATKRRMPPFVTIGRPDIQCLFREARHGALRNHQPRVAVCVCAPLRIVDLCRKACAKYSDRYVAFDFHYEVFE